MNKLLTTLFALAVASVTGSALAQAAAPAQAASAPAAAAQKTAPAAPAGAKSLEAKVAMCVGCHGIKGYQATFPEVHKVPMIAGQSAKYLVAALTAYKQGDRKHPTMRGIADSLSDQDMADIAGYYESLGKDPAQNLPAAADKAPSPQVAALLQKAACVSCHGANYAKPIDPSYPKIAGQHADYMFVALKAYKTEGNPQVGRANGVMGAIAKQFSNAELKALAGYVSSLDGDLKTVPEHRFR
ncbi:cytochrome c [Ramlibacter sp. WS9]|uniref:c-type cytochrome n=1 Tax=Ramlibacter sp. WS9 TaxID=1882741 RepID=UPI001141365C|nr:c-type cytochrome [Ramlibacter sp. WS9]ROZ79663.1 cytochrome c4 [Ramlibacter sp. WS9]